MKRLETNRSKNCFELDLKCCSRGLSVHVLGLNTYKNNKNIHIKSDICPAIARTKS